MAADSLVAESVQNPAKYYRNNTVASLALADAMRDAGVSIESLMQRGATADGQVLVAIVTHEGPERAVAQALERLRGSPSIVGQPMWMHILG